MVVVLDASAMIAYLRGEAGGDTVQRVIASEKNRCIAHALNFCEVFYDFHRAAGIQQALRVIKRLQNFGVEESNLMDTDLWQEAASIKSVWRRVSLADCFAIALAVRLDATFLTSDHHELDPIAAANLCRVEFIR